MIKKKQIVSSSWFVFSILLLVGCGQNEYQPLPKLGNYDINYETGDTIFPSIPDFQYLNQDSVVVSSKSMKGKIWVSDFFFTSCPTICPVMTEEMKRLNQNTSDLKEHIQFMSFSINPRYDKPSVLRKYIQKHGITASNWYFFTGDEKETHQLGIDHFLVHANADEQAPGGFAHGPAFTLVDMDGIVRGVYDGTDPKQVDQLEHDLRNLLKYEYDID